ncbi:hypothetical protein F4859DRAFT_312728 [Xylaria cf. heliscus]|nr:hypothetical protein F4859DRAFT_312728 [Xylaria cf. heliscus]
MYVPNLVHTDRTQWPSKTMRAIYQPRSLCLLSPLLFLQASAHSHAPSRHVCPPPSTVNHHIGLGDLSSSNSLRSSILSCRRDYHHLAPPNQRRRPDAAICLPSVRLSVCPSVRLSVCRVQPTPTPTPALTPTQHNTTQPRSTRLADGSGQSF